MNLFLIFNTFANLIFNFVSSSASVSITGSPSKLLHLIVDVDVVVAQAEAEPVRMLLGCRAEAMLRRPTPAFIYNFVQLTLAQAELWPRRRTRSVCPTALAKSVARFCISFLALGKSWHWHWLHGALLVSRVIYVPADTRWRWLKPFRLLHQPPSPLLAPSLARLLACPFGVSPYFLIRSYPWAALFAQAQPKQIDFQRNATYAVTSCSPPLRSPLLHAPCLTYLATNAQ